MPPTFFALKTIFDFKELFQNVDLKAIHDFKTILKNGYTCYYYYEKRL